MATARSLRIASLLAELGLEVVFDDAHLLACRRARPLGRPHLDPSVEQVADDAGCELMEAILDLDDEPIQRGVGLAFRSVERLQRIRLATGSAVTTGVSDRLPALARCLRFPAMN